MCPIIIFQSHPYKITVVKRISSRHKAMGVFSVLYHLLLPFPSTCIKLRRETEPDICIMMSGMGSRPTRTGILSRGSRKTSTNVMLKGPGKRGHIVADTNVSLFARPRNICCGHKFCVWDTKNVSDFVQKYFISATNVSQFAQPKKQHEQRCVLVCQYLKNVLLRTKNYEARGLRMLYWFSLLDGDSELILNVFRFTSL